MSPQTTKKPPPKSPPPKRSGSGVYVALIVAAVVVVIAVVAVIVTRSDSSDDSNAGPQTYPVQVTGPALAKMPDPPAADPAIGSPAPTLTGQSLFDGSAMTITPGGGTPKLLVFVAHWCPHCQREVPVLVDWMASGQMPAGLEVVAISTANGVSGENSPASAWLQREHWPTPVMADSDENAAAGAYRLPAFPYLVVLGPDGTVKARVTGELTAAELTTFVTNALA